MQAYKYKNISVEEGMKEKPGDNFHFISTIQSSVKNHSNHSVNVSL